MDRWRAVMVDQILNRARSADALHQHGLDGPSTSSVRGHLAKHRARRWTSQRRVRSAEEHAGVRGHLATIEAATTWRPSTTSSEQIARTVGMGVLRIGRTLAQKDDRLSRADGTPSREIRASAWMTLVDIVAEDPAPCIVRAADSVPLLLGPITEQRPANGRGHAAACARLSSLGWGSTSTRRRAPASTLHEPGCCCRWAATLPPLFWSTVVWQLTAMPASASTPSTPAVVLAVAMTGGEFDRLLPRSRRSLASTLRPVATPADLLCRRDDRARGAPAACPRRDRPRRGRHGRRAGRARRRARRRRQVQHGDVIGGDAGRRPARTAFSARYASSSSRSRALIERMRSRGRWCSSTTW